MLKLARSWGVRGERTEHTKIFSRTLAGFGLTCGQKVHFSTFDGKLDLQCIRNGPQNPPFCPGSLQDTFIIYSSILHQHIFQKYFAKRKRSRIENLKIWKSKNPGSLTGAWRGQFLEIFLFGVISGNINPPGGYRGQIPDFWKPRFQPKVKVWKRFGRFILMIFFDFKMIL